MLILTAQSSMMDDKCPCDGLRCFEPEIVFDHGQSHVDTRRHASRRQYLSIADEEAISVDFDGGETRSQSLRVEPVSGRLTLVQEAARRKQEGAHAHARGTSCSTGRATDPLDGDPIRGRMREGEIADDDEGVEAPFGCGSGGDRQSGRAGDLSTRRGQDDKAVRPRCGALGGRERLQRAAQIQQDEARVDEEGDRAGYVRNSGKNVLSDTGDRA